MIGLSFSLVPLTCELLHNILTEISCIPLAHTYERDLFWGEVMTFLAYCFGGVGKVKSRTFDFLARMYFCIVLFTQYSVLFIFN